MREAAAGRTRNSKTSALPIGSTVAGKSRHSPYGAVLATVAHASCAITDEELTTLWVGDLSPTCTAQDLMSGFGPFGRVADASLKGGNNSSGKRQGFVRYVSRQDAHMALVLAQQRKVIIEGLPVTCNWAQTNLLAGVIVAPEHQPVVTSMSLDRFTMVPSEPLRPQEIKTLWIGNIPAVTTEAQFIGVFSPYGELVSATISPKLSPQGSLSGFIRYGTQQDAALALTAVCSRLIRILGVPITASWAKENTRPTPGLASFMTAVATPSLGSAETQGSI